LERVILSSRFPPFEDAISMRTVGTWNLNPSMLKLFVWSSDFNLNTQRNSYAQVWIRIFGLAQEYWRPKILFAIGSSVGTPIYTDVVTSMSMFERTFGHFARVLVDTDLLEELTCLWTLHMKIYLSFA